tara:strand:+ start:18943 stop:19320 length:378 start_codon:yes stop_codon:yes gene_type:complete
MNTLLRILVVVPGIFFTCIGLLWLIAPANAAAALGMPLLDGVGRSTQVADMAVFFLALGMMTVLAAISLKSRWFQLPALILLGAAAFRVLAWLVHDAALAVEPIALEVVVACLLLFASARLAEKE